MSGKQASGAAVEQAAAAAIKAAGASRGEVRLAGMRRVSHGLQRPSTDSDAWTELLRDLAAWLLVLPAGAVLTHLTGAMLRGWELPRLPDDLPVFAAVRTGQRRPRRPGLLCARLVGESHAEVRHGLPVDGAEEILLRAARDLGVLDLVIMINSALRLGDIDPDRMEALLRSRRPGVRQLRTAWLLADRRAESAGETVLHLFHRAIGVPVEPQVRITDESGRFLGRVDLLVSGTRLVHEYDGEHHRGKVQQRTDLRRERGLSPTYTRRGFTLDDLLNHPAATMHEIDRTLGRAHQSSRLTRWRVLVENSMYSASCRRRLLLRWQRATGVIDWSRVA
ncbi:hypothetical protein [Nocardioides sp. cx-173]|uniref:hypothetical protein n=1 Tax=Nocardioides sp. cx-173 TaxID=2898796 RepID=UPI001E63CF0A|nr:hypothetical protein [Nocardioides sp. cx-173]MCD4525754.1 hypothetical protein [Nocardioides sp. cx-173]UGB39915.1 hypothetical protein LQ940_10895 [Nocardioides sp. cx-173]